MKKLAAFVLVLLTLAACGDAKENAVILTDSSGNINNLNVVIENELWKGEVGEAIRRIFAAPVDGLPQDEPLFSISQMPPSAFKGFARKNRTFLAIEKESGAEADIKIARDPYARPQVGIFVTGETNEEIINLLQENSEKIVELYKMTEITEQQRRIGKSLQDDSELQENLGVSLDFPTAYRYAKEDDDFFWIRKDIPHGSMEILVYEVPLSSIDRDSTAIADIVALRDSVGKARIPGPIEGSYMKTEEAYAPYLFESEIDGKFAYKTKGMWDVENFFMAGPFIQYAVFDEENDRIVVLEGFAFEPSASKRDNMTELDAILRSAEIE